MNRRPNVLCFLLFTGVMQAQVPDTDLWLFELEKAKTGGYSLAEGRNITARPGYDNQPSFDKEGRKILYVSMREDKQSDIYSYSLKKKKASRLTSTAVSEYSPRLSENGKSFYCVMVETDSTQRVHRVDLEKKTDEFISAFDSVGYCTFVNADTAVYYKLTEPHSLRYHVVSTGEDRWLADRPIRTFLPLNRHAVLFGIRTGSGVTLYAYDFLLRKSVRYAYDEKGSEHFFYHPAWGLLRSAGSVISQLDPVNGTWSDLFDLGAAGLKNIGRFAIDPQSRSLVVTEDYSSK